ncbi:MAG: ribulose-phosphate 3-epimerase [bacterium]|nr:ribulose-phosphate 3-epimerase [bacterium]
MFQFADNRQYGISASLICGDPLGFKDEIRLLECAQVERLHFDVMDGSFVPRLGMYPEVLKAIKAATNIPVDIHLMINEPEKYVPAFIDAGADLITVHIESTKDFPAIIGVIKSAGRQVGVALKPITDVSVIEPVIDEIDLILLMAIQPGILGQKMVPRTYQKIAEAREHARGRDDILIEVDGGVTPESAPEIIRCGANLLVCGTGTIYRPHEDTLENKVYSVRKTIDTALSL